MRVLWCVCVCVLLLDSSQVVADGTGPFEKKEVADGDAPHHLDGRMLFTRSWKPRDPECPDGDGLGPCFNGESCAVCHHQRGVGGGGGLEHNVKLLSALNPRSLREVAERRKNVPGHMVHPDLRSQATIVLHHFGSESEYEFFRFGMLGIRYARNMTATEKATFWANLAKRNRTARPVEELDLQGGPFQLAHRNTPALFGIGLIDEVADEELRTLETLQAEQAAATGITGRVAIARPRHNPLDDDDRDRESVVGRFGWRGQSTSLADFVLGACANELGLQTEFHRQPIDPVRPDYNLEGVDLDRQSCVNLVSFVRKLRRPVRVKPKDKETAQEASRGERIFERIGCSRCHVPHVGGVDELYSDLLLHDMGDALADMAAALPPNTFTGGYSGVAAELPAETVKQLQREWRTPPLWGVADSAPYLHDGRASNLPQAILAHGGEARPSRDEFQSLEEADRSHLIKFLLTLRAPPR